MTSHLRGTRRQMDLQVSDAVASIRSKDGQRPSSAPAAHRDLVDDAFAQPGQPSTLAARVKAIKQEAKSQRFSEDIETTLDEITRVFMFTVDEFDHIEWMLRHGLIDREGALDIAAKVGQPRMFRTSPTSSPAPMINTSHGTQAPEGEHKNAMPISWAESSSTRPTANPVSTADQGTTMDGMPEPSARPPAARDSILGHALAMAQAGEAPSTINDFAASVSTMMGGGRQLDPSMQSPQPTTTTRTSHSPPMLQEETVPEPAPAPAPAPAPCHYTLSPGGGKPWGDDPHSRNKVNTDRPVK